MASLCNCSLSCPPYPRTQWNPSRTRPFLSIGLSPTFPGHCISSVGSAGCRAAAPDKARRSSFANEASMSIDNLHRFINLNVGKWNGAFHQFDTNGNLLHKVDTKLSASSYGEDQLISLIQTLYIKQPPSSTSVLGEDKEPDWAEYKIKETNMFTVDKYQQMGFFPQEKAFALRYQTAGMLETVLRQGVLGEDDTGEESPRNLKLPSYRPSIVCESCLYSQERDMRARAFHIMDPKGVIEMLLIFLEKRDDGVPFSPTLDNSKEYDSRIIPFLGKWKGRSITKRSGVYGATIAEADSVASLEMDEKGHLIQDIASTSNNGEVTTNVHWTGTMSDNLITFDGGYQMTLLPGGMYMGCPSDVAKSVAESKSFHLEFCWLEAPGKRQRLIRTYDIEGLAVSSTYLSETQVTR
ncbi:uncharacterized protein LOC116208303 isoform X2 [Punica granatum]|uniref:Uncharacterized protein LOC116208303 isoform X2 n=2 Tax=Punica granatum TaxID=22663 RepID=A0A218VVG8_PUNGR|nr:uncharacterized protein LOC116208303 isoform X2 [Punica granatum]OWM64554.1 hypothetical protein CDL15_Pgr020521 [Punica granatum]